jgi:hypothetical protein
MLKELVKYKSKIRPRSSTKMREELVSWSSLSLPYPLLSPIPRDGDQNMNNY